GFQTGVPHRFAPDQFGSAAPGSVWAVADAEICAPAGTTGEVDVSTSNFKLTFTDNTRVDATFSGPGAPALTFGTVRSGECIRGALNFAVSPNKTPSQIVYEVLFGDG